MQSLVGALTEKRKENLIRAGRGQNSLHEPGMKPSGPDFSGYARGGKFRGSPAQGMASAGLGLALTLSSFGFKRRSKVLGNLTLLLGAGLMYRGLRNLFRPTDLMTRSETGLENPAASVQHLEGIKIEESLVIDRPANELYTFWRDVSNLPRVMRHLDRVEVMDAYRSHWYAKAPFGIKLDWEAEIYMEKPGEMLSWRSAKGSMVETAGSVRFDPVSGTSTKVSVMMKIEPPLNRLGIALARLFDKDPSVQIREDLANFKQWIEGCKVRKSLY